MKKITHFIKYFLMKLNTSDTSFAAPFLAFHLLLSFIPLLVFLLQMLSLITNGFDTLIVNYIDSLPTDIRNVLVPIIQNVFETSSSLSIIAIISALWAGSQGFLGLILTLNRIFEIDTTKKVGILKKIPFFDRIFSVIYTIAFLVVMAVLLIFNVFNTEIINIIKTISSNLGTPLLKDVSDSLIFVVSLLLPLLVSIAMFMFFYKFSSAFYKDHSIPFDAAFFGSLFVTIAIFLLSLSYKISNHFFASGGNPVYGSLGSVMVALVWLLGICQCIILGGVFIKTYIDVVKEKKTYEPLSSNQKN